MYKLAPYAHVMRMLLARFVVIKQVCLFYNMSSSCIFLMVKALIGLDWCCMMCQGIILEKWIRKKVK